MKFIIPIVSILGMIFILGIGILCLWALFKFGKSYKYERDDPLSTLPKGIGLLELFSPKNKRGILNTDNEESHDKTDR